MKRLLGIALVAACLSACGGNVSDIAAPGDNTGTPPPATGGGGNGGGTGGGGTGGGGNPAPPPAPPPPPPATAKSCEAEFDPARIAAGDDCSNKAGQYCALPQGLFALSGSVAPCDGITVQSVEFTSRSGQVSHYLVLKGSRQPASVYMALHYLASRVETFSNVIRLQELARERDALVIVPQAPSAFGLDSLGLPLGGVLDAPGSRWPVYPAVEAVEPFIEFLDDVVSDVRNRFDADGLPLLISGLSNGGAMAYQYACLASDRVDAVLSVASSMSAEIARRCTPSRAVGTVIVHGTADVVTPYDGALNLGLSIPDVHAKFKAANGCTGNDIRYQTAPDDTRLTTVFDEASNGCRQNRRQYLVTIQDGIHRWPSQVTAIEGALPSQLNTKPDSFDATLQGYDLLKLASGRY